MLPLLLAAALTQTPQHRLFLQPNLPRSSQPPLALFEFAPASGAGMTAPCACAAVTGAKGEAMTFTRSSSGTCLKGNVTTGIADGDLVTCSTNQPRVMPGGDGSGGVGLLVEGARTNICLRSEELDNAAWTDFTAGGGAAPTKGSANTDVAPDGTTTAERVTFAATTATESSGLSQTIFTAAAYSGCLFARGNDTTASGSFDICIDTAASQTCSTCSYVLGGWTRCSLTGVTSKASGLFYIGNLSSLNGGTVRAEQTPTLWGASAEAGSFCSSYIKTEGSAVTRAADSPPSMTIPSFTPGNGYSAAVTLVQPRSTSSMVFMEQGTSGNLWQLYLPNAAQVASVYVATGGGGSTATANITNVTTVNASRVYGWLDPAADLIGAMETTAGNTAAANWSATAWRFCGSTLNGTVPNGVCKEACLDSSTTRCRR